MNAPKPHKPNVRKRRRTTCAKKACANCRKSHVACDDNRPCYRCKQKGILCYEIEDVNESVATLSSPQQAHPRVRSAVEDPQAKNLPSVTQQPVNFSVLYDLFTHRVIHASTPVVEHYQQQSLTTPLVQQYPLVQQQRAIVNEMQQISLLHNTVSTTPTPPQGVPNRQNCAQFSTSVEERKQQITLQNQMIAAESNQQALQNSHSLIVQTPSPSINNQTMLAKLHQLELTVNNHYFFGS